MNESRGSENLGAKKGRGAHRLPAELSRANLNAAGIDVGVGNGVTASHLPTIDTATPTEGNHR